jgi:aarF domain-containing kinase
MNELDFVRERRNLDQLHATAGVKFSSVICIPESVPELCNDRVITMTFLEGPKLEDEVLRRLRAVGIDRGSTDIRQFLRDQAASVRDSNDRATEATAAGGVRGALVAVASALGPANVLWLARSAQKVRDVTVWACCEAVRWAEAAGLSTRGMSSWRDVSVRDLSTRHTEAETTMWLHTLLDVHGYEIFHCPLFNSDPHPGNIIVMPDGRLGLIDYGQCKTFTDERTKRNIAGENVVTSSFTALCTQLPPTRCRFLSHLHHRALPNLCDPTVKLHAHSFSLCA